ncbi:MAG TPA: hypothetical protein VGM88_14275 [Kofleriaceae bacterium]
MTTHRIVRAVAVGVLFAAACQSGDDPQPSPDPAPTESTGPLVAGPKRDLAVIAERAVLGFRSEGSELHAGFDTHDAVVHDNLLELTPATNVDGQRVTGATLGLSTAQIIHGDNVMVGGQSAALDETGAVRIARDAAVETLVNREDGVEQSWTFPAEPAGDGDLEIQISATGEKYIAETATGLHFAGDSGLGFVYGQGVWTDAAGREWPIQPRWRDGVISLTIPEDVLADTTFPATLDPTISSEQAVDTATSGFTAANTAAPAIAFDGINFLVVWSDNRLSTDDDIYATRVTVGGAILDPLGIKIAATAGKQLHPTVAYNGTSYIVAWEDYKTTGSASADIGVATVVPATGVVTSLGYAAATSANETQPHLATSGANALLVWNAAGTITGSLFNGTSFGAGVAISPASSTDPAVAANPAGNYLVAWSQGTTTTADLYAVPVTAAGAVSGSPFVVSAGAGQQYAPTAAWDGTNYDLVWTVNNSGVNLYGSQVSTANAVLQTHLEGTTTVGGEVISAAAGNQEVPQISCGTGTAGCFVIWQDRRNQATTNYDIYGQLLTSAFALSGSEVIVSNAGRPQQAPAIAWSSANYLSAWVDNRDSATNTITGTRIAPGGAVMDAAGIVFVQGTNREQQVGVGRLGANFGLFWSDSHNYGSDIELVRFTGATKLDATVHTISSAQYTQQNPAATVSETGNMFAVWSDTRGGVDHDIYGSRVDANGNALDTAGIAITTATGEQLLPSVATNGTVALAVWQDRRGGANFDVYGALVDISTGSITLADIVICNAAGDQSSPSATWDALHGQFIVAWTDARVTNNQDIYAARLSTAGAVLDANGILVSGAANGQFAPKLATINGVTLAAWEDRRTDLGGDIYGARLQGGTSLQVLDAAGVAIATGTSQQNQAAIGSTGGNFLVAWTDNKNAATTGLDIYGQLMTTTATLNGASFAISTDVGDESTSSLTSTQANGVARIGYQLTRSDLGTVRVESRTIQTSGSTGQACSSAASCSTGFCVDGKCCDTACGNGDNTDCQACAYSKTNQPDGTCAPLPPTTACRNYADTYCDLREYCDGVNSTCPVDTGRNQGLVCTKAAGGTGHCPLNTVAGAPHVCQ